MNGPILKALLEAWEAELAWMRNQPPSGRSTKLLAEFEEKFVAFKESLKGSTDGRFALGIPDTDPE